MSDPRSDHRSDNRSDAAPGSSEGSRAFREEVLANTARLLVLEAVDKLQDKSDQDPVIIITMTTRFGAWYNHTS